MTHPTDERSPLSTALIVDDDTLARRLAAGVLRSLGAQTLLEAPGGLDALTLLRKEEHKIDLVICDLEMDEMDGVEFLTELGSTKPGMAVVLVSGMARPLIAAVEEMARGAGLRVLGALEKPIDRTRLGQILEPLNRPVAGAAAPRAHTAIPIEDIRVALADRQFVLFFQPKIDLRNGKLVGAEALARWYHPKRGLVPPGAFIPAIEECGLINELTWLLFDSAARTAASWQQAGLDIALNINITVGFLEELAVTENILALTRSNKLSPDRMVLEITESMATTDLIPVIGNLARLRMRGFGLAIDDFGTGYSTMQQLSRIPFSELKVDRTFVSGALRKPDVRAILESSLELGRRLQLQTTAEGIETPAELALIRSIGCDAAQGYLFAKPMDRESFDTWAHDWVANGAERMTQLATV